MDEPGEKDSSDYHQNQVKMILVVEDDEAIGSVIQQILLLETPYRVALATDGPQALHMVQQITPQLFVMDYQLPSMNGLELARHLLARPALGRTPVILMSAYTPEMITQPHPFDFLKKPFELDELLQLVRKHLEV
jgi:two-component system phosphate regulon response regulator PhoB